MMLDLLGSSPQQVPPRSSRLCSGLHCFCTNKVPCPLLACAFSVAPSVGALGHTELPACLDCFLRCELTTALNKPFSVLMVDS